MKWIIFTCLFIVRWFVEKRIQPTLTCFWSTLRPAAWTSVLILTLTAVERSAPNMGLPCPTVLALQGSLLSASPNPPRQDTPSPIPLLPDPCSAVSSKGKLKASSIYSTAKNHSSSKTRSLQYVSSPLSLTSTGPNTAEVKHHLTCAGLIGGFSWSLLQTVQTSLLIIFVLAYKIGECIQTII